VTESTPQYTRASLAKMTPAQIVAAKRAGQLEAIQSGAEGDTEYLPERPEQLSRDDLAGLTPAEIWAAKKAGALDDLIDGSDPAYS
jgi:hypothetical protein